MQANEMYMRVVKLLLPAELSEYFEIVDVDEVNGNVHLYLEEQALCPDGYESDQLSPNGFYAESVIRDFPIRDKGVYLHVKRRRWIEKRTGKSVSKDWELVAQGTRHSKEFAAFLKGLLGEIPDYGPLS
jgi:transposase